MIATLLTVLMLHLSALDGVAPLETVATVTVDRATVAYGRACLIWISETAAEGFPADHIQCWDISAGDPQTVWEKRVAFGFPGVWTAWVQVMGWDKRGKIMNYMTPSVDVVTK